MTASVLDRIRNQLKRWQQDLISFNRNNRLIYFRRSKRSSLEIRAPEPANLARALAEGVRLEFYEPQPREKGQRLLSLSLPLRSAEEGDNAGNPADELDTRDSRGLNGPRADQIVTSEEDPTSLRGILRNLERRSTQEFLEKGLWILYITLGFLEWVESIDGAEERVRSPLLLLPVQIEREGPSAPFTIQRTDEDPVANPALAAKLEHDFGINLPAGDSVEDADPTAFLSEVETLIAGRPGWSVVVEAGVGCYSFHKEVMYRDLRTNEAQIACHPLVSALVTGGDETLSFSPKAEEELDEKDPPEDSNLVLDADSSQRQCVVAALDGRSFVMDGPPGTGKSQTIANVIAASLQAGKTILFVSEKAAALEVVYSRLEAAGLSDYAFALHSHRSTRKEVAKELARSLMERPTPPRVTDPLLGPRLKSLRRELSGYADAVNVTRHPLNRSMSAVLGRLEELRQTPSLPKVPIRVEGLSDETLAALVDSAKQLGRHWSPVEEGERFAWRGLDTAAPDLRRVLETLLEGADQALRALRFQVDAGLAALGLRWPATFETCERLRALDAQLNSTGNFHRDWLTAPSLEDVETRCMEVRALTTRIISLVANLGSLGGERFREIEPNDAMRVNETEAQLASLNPALAPLESLSCSRLIELASKWSEVTNTARAIGQTVSQLATGCGWQGETDFPGDVRALRSVAMLHLAARPIESSWLTPEGIRLAEIAASTLEPISAEASTLAAELGATFRDEVLALDLRRLCARFDNAYRGLGKLRPSYWKDRRVLASVTHARRATRETWSLLPKVIEWQESTEKLRTESATHAPTLGSRFRNQDTDWSEVRSALALARAVLVNARTDQQIAVARRLVVSGAAPSFDAPGLLRDLDHQLHAWNLHAEDGIVPIEKAFASRPCSELVAWCERGSSLLKELADVASRVLVVTRADLSLKELDDLLQRRLELALEEARLARQFGSNRLAFGDRYNGVETDWGAVTEGLAKAAALRGTLGGSVPSAVAESLLAWRHGRSELVSRFQDWEQARDALLDCFLAESRSELGVRLNGTFPETAESLARLKLAIPAIDTWIFFSQAIRRLKALGLGALTDMCVSLRLSRSAVAPAIERSVLEAWVDSLLATDGRLDKIDASDRTVQVEEFAELDRKLSTLSLRRIIEACNARRPATSAGVGSLILREGEKVKRHMPTRDLIDRARAVVQAIKPCFMMSPLTVSQFLPPSLVFDLVIFDEASQVRPCDAVNCIYRGKQLIVAGDQKQLPPTSFFERGLEDEEYEEDEPEEFESVLDICRAAAFPPLSLRWHYRSRHEDLISFSNYSFYDGRLLTFPGSQRVGSDLGVELFHTQGMYRRGGARDNPIEAAAVAERVVFHRRQHPDLTLGVVALSEAQAGAIEAELEKRCTTDSTLGEALSGDRLTGFFVKNLENVQGDERDILILSIGYGRDENGKFLMNFGPLNRQGGARRLNVAITRARRRLEVVSSVLPEEFRGGEMSEGARLLNRYLDFASRPDNKLRAITAALGVEGGDAESPFEAEVARLIVSWGYKVVSQVGSAGYRVDIAVENPASPGVFALGVECDGASYHSSKVARDRDRLRQQVLEGLGWRLHRIWGPSWYRNRGEQEGRLKRAIEDAVRMPPIGASKEVELGTPVRTSRESVALDTAPEWVKPYRVARVSPPRRRLEMHDPSAHEELLRLILEVLDTESPVAAEVVLRRVRVAWGVDKAGSRIRRRFELALEALARTRRIERRGEFLALPDGRPPAVRRPTSDAETFREVSEVPPQELRLALTRLAVDAVMIERNELLTKVARLFGWSRRGTDISQMLSQQLDGLVREGRVLAEGGSIRVVEVN